MAAQYISDQIKTRGAKGVVDAADVAYSYKTEGIEQIDKSVADKIEDLEDAIENLQPANIDEQIASVNNSVTQANTAKQLAESAKDLALSYKNAAETAANSVQDLKSDLETVKELADTFSTGFDADATFAIVSETQYNNTNKSDLRDNCIYFCYK